MSNLNTEADHPTEMPVAGVGRAWAWLLAYGVITLLTGLVALLWPGPTIFVLSVLFGAQLLVGGIFWFINALASDAKGTAVQILLAVLAVVAGVVVLRAPGEAALVFPLVLGLFWIVAGVIETFHALAGRGVQSRGWAATAGLLALLTGILLISYPGLGLLAMTYLLGVWLVIYGGIEVVRAFRMRPHAASARREAGRPAHA